MCRSMRYGQRSFLLRVPCGYAAVLLGTAVRITCLCLFYGCRNIQWFLYFHLRITKASKLLINDRKQRNVSCLKIKICLRHPMLKIDGTTDQLVCRLEQAGAPITTVNSTQHFTASGFSSPSNSAFCAQLYAAKESSISG